MPQRSRYAYFRVRRGWSTAGYTLELSSDSARMAVIRLWDQGKAVSGSFDSEAQLREVMGRYYRFVPELRKKGWLDGLDIHDWDEDQVAADPSAAERQRRRRAKMSGDDRDGHGGGRARVTPDVTPSVTGVSRTPTLTSTSTSTEVSVPDGTSSTERVDQVFEAWKKAAGKNGATVLSPKRRQKIQQALKAYPIEDVLDAVWGWRNSPHHCGANESGTVYNELELLLRDAAHIEKFRDLKRNGPSRRVEPQEAQRKMADRELDQWAQQQPDPDDPGHLGA